MAITPQTNIQLLDCPLTVDQENQLTFNNVTAQTAYFEGLPKKSLKLEDCTYQRKDSVIRYAGNIDSLIKYNYVRYQNSGFSNKWFYAFIDHMEYVSEYTTLIYIKTDVYQTWMFDITLEPSFIEREHVASDGYGEHTLPEGLEYGPYIIGDYLDMNQILATQGFVCMQVSDFPDKAKVTSAPERMYNGMPSGCWYLVFALNNLEGLNRWIKAYADESKADAILSIFPIPGALADPQVPGVPNQVVLLTNDIDSQTLIFTTTNEPVVMSTITVDGPFGQPIDGYTPKNNKLYTSPYCYFYLNTFAGSTIEYTYEQFNGPIYFDFYGSITSGCEIKAVPRNIGNVDAGSYGYGMSMAAMPQASWNNDTYLNWRALNMDAINIQTTSQVASAAVSGAGSLFSWNLAGAAQAGIDAATAIAMANNQKTVAQKMPDQARGDTATQSLAWSLNKLGGAIYCMTIKAEYAKIIDQYFTMYGYKVNELKVPNINSRQYFNYVRAIGMNLVGELPQNDLLELKNIFNRGCTFWHDPNNFLNYNVNNSII